MIRFFRSGKHQKYRDLPALNARLLILLNPTLLLATFTLILPVFAQINPRKTTLLNKTSAVRIAGNDFYEIVIEGGLGRGVGLYSVRTGKLHPVTLHFKNVKQDLLVGGGKAATGPSYTTIRSYGTKRDYVQSELAVQDITHRIVWLDTLFINNKEIKPDTSYFKRILTDTTITGYRVIYSLPGLPRPDMTVVIPDTMEITQVINVHGREFDDSWVEVSTILKNTGSRPITAGIRYFWDVAVAGDDGPIMKTRGRPDFSFFESTQTHLDFAFFMLSANDSIKSRPPAYHIFGSALTPTALHRAPFQPVRIQQVSWSRAFFRSFDYVVDNNLIVTTRVDPNAELTGGDNAIQYFWGERPETALTFWPGQTIAVTQALFAALPEKEPTAVVDWDPPKCEISILSESPRSIAVTIQDGNSGLHSVRTLEQQNVNVVVPEFDYGANAPVRIIATAIDETQPFILMLEIKDLCDRIMICDPIWLTLAPAYGIFKYTLAPIETDRYLYIKNQGLAEIDIQLNGHAFALRTNVPAHHSSRNVFKMPAQGEITIDLARYMKDKNTMAISFVGPPESRANLILSDETIKGAVDYILDLAPLPQQFTLWQNVPNPFRGQTHIQFEVPMRLTETQPVKITVYNTLGQVVRTLVNANLSANTHFVEWDGRNDAGRVLSAGIYFYRLEAGETHLTKKMVLLQR